MQFECRVGVVDGREEPRGRVQKGAQNEKTLRERNRAAPRKLGQAGRRDLLATRHSATDRAPARRVFGLWRAVSCGRDQDGGERSWISAAVSLSRTTIGPAHSGSAKDRSEHGRPRPLARRAVSVPSRASASTAARKRHAAGGEEAKVSDAHDPLGSRCQRNRRRNSSSERSQPRFVLVSGVAPTESNLLVGQRDQAMVGDGHAVRVAAQILEHIVRAPEGWFGVDHQSCRNRGRSQAAKVFGWASRARFP